MGNLVKSELYKLQKDRSLWTLIVILMASAIFYPVLIFFDNGANSATVNDFYIGTALSGNDYIIRLVPCILAGFFISSEYSNGTMKSIGASGNNRIRIYFAKLLAFSIGAVIISLVFPLVILVASTILFGAHDLPALDYVIQTMGLTILYAAAFASIMSLFSIIFSDSGKTIGFLLIFFLLFDSILYLLSKEFAFVEAVFNYSVFKLFLDIKAELSNGAFLKILLVPVITWMVFGFLGSFIFQKKEIK
ncbi:ABC transporter permease [Neobacillus sp. MM2021_6]|uniref:ABC transporter permease n=1 Tax=Bacillaceae TaxID=186817 RepID=UPI0014097D5F|nr:MULTISPECIES: ABC transporter permease [Bacillaceae]MBO0960480.1 ABC transporter permease [Neobacillus sp. MM2021_6]NHC19639.1 ABC transporter permease [Bacillus sp. MM2020_4]